MAATPLPVIRLTRFQWDQEGTLGVLRLPNDKTLFTLELPWRDNLPEVSCIPSGEYDCFHHARTPSGRAEVFSVRNVPGRTGVLIHSGNYAGNTELGFKTHSLGCILPGRAWGTLLGQKAVLASAPAMRDLNLVMNRGNFRLVIEYLRGN